MDKKVTASVSTIQQLIDTEQWQTVEKFINDNHYDLFSQGRHKETIWLEQYIT